MARKSKTTAPITTDATDATDTTAIVATVATVAPIAQKAYSEYSDDELKNFVINCMMTGSNYRKAFKSDYLTLLRVVNLLSTDPVFAKAYRDLLEHRLQHMEEDLLNGTYLEDIPRKFDKLGNEDLAPGYLKLAEMQIRNAQWMLERRNKKYQARMQQDITSNGEALNAIVLPAKQPKDDSVEVSK